MDGHELPPFFNVERLDAIRSDQRRIGNLYHVSNQAGTKSSLHSQMKNTGDTKGVPHPGDKVHIPLPFEQAVRGLLKVKPTKDMPRPGANPTKPKKKRDQKRKED